jgi:putative hydrolase
MLGQGGGMSWESAKQVAVGLATDGQSEPNVDPAERIAIEQLARVADLHVADVTGLATSTSGRGVAGVAVNRTRWAMDTIDAYRPYVERLSAALGPSEDQLAEADGQDDPTLAGDPMAGLLSGMMRSIQPMLLAVTAGSMVGHLARRTLGQYDLPIPRPLGGPGADDLLLVVPNLDEFAEGWSLPRDDVRLWVSVHEIAHHAVLGVPHVRARMDDLLARYTSSFSNDPQALEAQLGEIDITSPTALQDLQRAMGTPETILGAISSPEQGAIRPELDALVAVVVGVVDHVLDLVGGKLISSYGMLTEALRRRRVEAAGADRFVERLFGLELAQTTYERGARFVEGVIERAGDDGLRRLWAGAANLPTPAEVDAPGLWLARLDLD